MAESSDSIGAAARAAARLRLRHAFARMRRQKSLPDGGPMRRFALSTLACFVLAVAVAAAGVTVDYDKAVDFAKIKTYAWKKGTPAANPLNEERVRKAIEAQLAAKGLTKTEGEA